MLYWYPQYRQHQASSRQYRRERLITTLQAIGLLLIALGCLLSSC